MDDLHRVTEYAQLAREFIEDAGIRYMAKYWENQESKEEKSLALLGWITTVMVHGEKAATLFAFFVQMTAEGITDPEEMTQALRQAFPDAEGRSRVRERVEEYAKLLKMGEG